MDKKEIATGIIGIFSVIAIIAGYIGISIVCAYPVKWLWNWLMPELFGLGKISLMQAFGLQLLCSIFFKANVHDQTK